MIRPRPQLTVSVFAVMILITAATYADDSVKPKPVLMTENPLTAEQAKTVQKAWAGHLGVDLNFVNSIGMQLRVIPPGAFQMGRPNNTQKVTHSQPFLIGQYEVTQREWERVMGPVKSIPDTVAGDRFPMGKINHADAAEFCQKLTQRDRKAGKLPDGYEYRLPTDAEWEYACRAGTLTATHFGDKLSSAQANFDGRRPLKDAANGPNLGKMVEVGSYPANAWGLHDMHGNQGEWCLDYYHKSAKAGVDPVQLQPAPEPHTTHRLIRGGRFNGPANYCVSGNRYFERQEARTLVLGFRPVLTKLHLGKVAAATHADDSVKPKPVLMTKKPLTTEQAQAVQKAWANHLGFDVAFENSIGMELSVIPPGTFPMGPEDKNGEEGPQVVTHSQTYFIGRYEVTQGEWERVMGPIKITLDAGAGDRFPIYNVNYAEAAEFCRKLTQLDREAGKLPKGYEYRLPTTAEWEYACRAGTLTATYFGDKLTSRQANFNGSIPLNKAEKGPNLGRTAEVGSYPANAWGLHDTYGNLYEWCLDWHHAKLKGGVDPMRLLPTPERRIPERVRRGGCHSQAGRYCRSSNRYYHFPESRSRQDGFRPVLSKLHLDGLPQLTDIAHTDFYQTRTRDGMNTRIWHRWNSKTGDYYVKEGKVNSRPGESIAINLTDKSYHTWAHTCLTDGRILVQSNPPNQELGYYLMTPHKDAAPKFERIRCDLATTGVLDRISLSPSETRICFEFQTGFDSDVPGRTLYVADFDAKQPAITDARPFANEDGKPIWYAFPRWSKDESAIVYQADEKLYLYNLAIKSTTKMSRTDSADSPPMKRAPESGAPEPVIMTERPLTAAQAQSAQKAWADHLGFEVGFENSIGMKLRVIPPGTWHMRSPQAEKGQKGPVEVTLSQAFLIGQFEVTQGEWKRVMGPIERELDAGAGDRFPVYRVNHTEASEFCRKLTQLDRKANKLLDGYEYRLPTEAEWEFACRAGTLTRTHFGKNMSSLLANYDGIRPLPGSEKGPNLGRTAEVGTYPANAWGLHEMHGNLNEWCLDWYHHEVKGGVDPVHLLPPKWDQPAMMIRDCSWRGNGRYCHTTNRTHQPPQVCNSTNGFRPVLTKISLVATGEANSTQAADDSVEPEPVLMTKQALTAEQAQSVQKAWADHLGIEVGFENSIGMKLRVIPPGTWHMRSPQAEKGQKGPVEVTLSQAFLIGQFEVTQGEWKRVMGPIEGKLDAGAGDRFPVYHVNHIEATEFCRKLTQLDREAGKLPDGYEYRLQTAAEGEFACRAGTLTLTHFGDKMSSRLANYDGTRPLRDSEKGPFLGRTAEVGSYPANAWGLHDTHGNVAEWCMDWYHHKVNGGVDPVHLQPSDGKKPHMMFRAGAWRSQGMYCHSAHRYHFPPDGRSYIGLRPVLTKISHVATGQANSTRANSTQPADDSVAPESVLTTEQTASPAQKFVANYDESKIPEHTLPDPLVTESGKPVASVDDWRNVRRPELMEMFRTHVYGRSPEACKISHQVVSTSEDAVGGKAIRREVDVFFGESTDAHSMRLLIYTPKTDKAVAAFLGLNFQGNHSIDVDPSIALGDRWVPNWGKQRVKNNLATEKARGVAASRWPVEKIIDRGYGLVTIYCGDIDPDFDDGFKNGIHRAFAKQTKDIPAAEAWGAVAGWAYGLSRALDYLEQDDKVDGGRVAVFGHSRLGKTSLWAGASDERFKMVISNNSGCGGAALSRRGIGETVGRINTTFPYWFNDNFTQYNLNENACPVDQHELIALIAPRAVYVASAAGDKWADPKGEFLAALHAEPVYRLLRTDGFGVDAHGLEQPAPDQPIKDGTIGYHLRTGRHDITDFDWQQYLDFADRHLLEPQRVLMTEQPLTAEQARTAQNAWADHLGVEATFESSIGMQLSVIPPGTFLLGLGNPHGWDPQEVTHSQPYFIGRYEVTQGEWERVMGPLTWQPSAGAGDRFPVYNINYVEAAEFCRKLTRLDREAGKLPEGYEYRLPTSAELEYACRAGTLTATYLGDKLTSREANFDGNYPLNKAEKGPHLGRTAEVGSYPGNAWGLHDTYGNVFEWCLDWFHFELKGGVDPVRLLPTPERRRWQERVRRGGCYKHKGRYCQSSNRGRHVPESRSSEDGFRVVLSKLHLVGLHQLTDSAHTDFNQPRTRDGMNTRIWMRNDSRTGTDWVKAGKVNHIPGEAIALPLTDRSYHTWAYTCLTDGRILVRSNPPNQELGYYLMTPNKDAAPKFERIQCDLATTGVLDRISLSPSETRVCFEFQSGFDSGLPDRTLYVADFDAKQPAITNAKPFANEGGKPIGYAFPRWSKDESAIIYHADEQLHLYNLANKSTTKVSITDSVDDPRMKRAPK